MQRRALNLALTAAMLTAAFTAVLATVGACDVPEIPSIPAAPATRGAAPVSASVGEPPRSEAERAAVESARAGAQRLGGTLKTRLLSAMAEGPAHAASFCASNAQGLTAEVAEATGARVGRSSLRLRNPENAGPDWVREWLEARGEGPAEGVAPASGVSDGVARFVAPIAIEGPCLACHGPPADIDEGVREVIEARYPRDRATGYALGDLRGAIWAEVPVAR